MVMAFVVASEMVFDGDAPLPHGASLVLFTAITLWFTLALLTGVGILIITEALGLMIWLGFRAAGRLLAWRVASCVLGHAGAAHLLLLPACIVPAIALAAEWRAWFQTPLAPGTLLYGGPDPLAALLTVPVWYAAAITAFAALAIRGMWVVTAPQSSGVELAPDRGAGSRAS